MLRCMATKCAEKAYESIPDQQTESVWVITKDMTELFQM